MKKIIGILLAAALLLTLAGCKKEEKSQIDLSKFDLGVRYLSDGNYEEALAAFQAAIEIDPKKKDAYFGLADVYVAMNDTQMAIESLLRALEELGEDPQIIKKLEELGVTFEETLENQQTTPDGRFREELGEDGYALVRVDENGYAVEREFYTTDDVLEGTAVYERDENGTVRVTTAHNPDGSLFSVSNYRADGSCEKTVQYDADGSYCISYNSEDGLQSKTECYDAGNTMRYYVVLQFDNAYNVVSEVSYYPDGSVMSEEGVISFN